MPTKKELLIVFLGMIGAAGLVGLYISSWWLVAGEMPRQAAPLYWGWDNITVENWLPRKWDPLIAALWVSLPILSYLIEPKYSDLGKASLFGLAAAIGYCFVFRGEPSIAAWLLTPPMVLIIAVISDSLDRYRLAKQGHYLSEQFGLGQAIAFCLNFGFGLLLPFALLYGFYLGALMWWLFSVLCITLCFLLFLIIWYLRLIKWLVKKITYLELDGQLYRRW